MQKTYGPINQISFLKKRRLIIRNRSKNITNLTIASFLIFIISTFHLSAQNYKFHNFKQEDGLPQPYVYSLIQDSQGYLWVGTGDGLSRYNGFNFENYSVNDSLADNFITCSISEGESLWFGHMNGNLTYFDGREMHPFNLSKLNLSTITNFSTNPDGTVWASTFYDGLLKLDKTQNKIKQYTFNSHINIFSFSFIDANSVLVCTDSGLKYCQINESGQIKIIQTITEIPESKVNCIQKMRNKQGFYISTENDGIFQLSFRNNIFKVSKIKAPDDIKSKNIQYLFEDSQSNLWLATFGNGLIKMTFSATGEFTTIDYFNKIYKFEAENVKTIFEDREGNIWVGNYGEGLTQISTKAFTVFRFDNSLYSNNILAIYSDQNYRWIGTENGLVKMDQKTDKILKFYGNGNGLPKDAVTAIYSNISKELWIGTEKNGVFRLDVVNDKINKVSIGNGELENSVNCISGNKSQVWIGTKKGLCCINLKNPDVKWYTISQGGLPHNFINCLYEDKKGRFWISTRSSKLAYIEDGKVIKVPLNITGGTLILGPITEDNESRIWVGSNGYGAFRIEADSVANFTVKEGLYSNFCYSLISDSQNNIWVSHNGGLSRIRTSDFSITALHQFEGITDNYQFNANTVNKDQQQRLLFGANKGIIVYDPDLKNKNLQAPVLGITSIRINDEEKNYKEKIILSPGKYRIKINFIGISLKDPDLVTYQYQLEGFDQWSEITKNTSITYNNLEEGEYNFILKASSGDGIVTEFPLKMSIIIEKPIWKKWWFYLITASLFFSLMYTYIKRREYKILKEKAKLEQLVTERTHEIQTQKNEIEAQRNLINLKNLHITASIRYARNIQTALFPPIDLINKLLPDNFILNQPKEIISGDFYWFTEKDNKIIFSVADCTGHGIPGAVMSILGISLLNEIVKIQGITSSNAIVAALRERVIDSLKQSRKDSPTNDGMDIALCSLDPQLKKIQFTGSINDLVYIRNHQINKVNADRFSISSIHDDMLPFTMKEIDYKEGDILYLFSDGYKDQFGGSQNKKFMVRQFYAILLEIHELPMQTQKEILLKRLKAWMEGYEQTDDITLIGIRL